MPQFQANVYVTLRPSVLDPAGVAVEAGIHHLGYSGVKQVRIGKFIELSLTATDEAQAKNQLETICDQLLANPVIEVYRVELSEAPVKTPLTTG